MVDALTWFYQDVSESMSVLPIKLAKHSSRIRWLEIFFFSMNCRQFAIVTDFLRQRRRRRRRLCRHQNRHPGVKESSATRNELKKSLLWSWTTTTTAATTTATTCLLLNGVVVASYFQKFFSSPEIEKKSQLWASPTKVVLETRHQHPPEYRCPHLGM